MDRVFDRIIIAVPDLDAATRDYRALLGCEPVVNAGDDGACWLLHNTAITLQQRPVATAVVVGPVIKSDGGVGLPQPVENSLGIELASCDGSYTAALRETGELSGLKVDHLVLRTADADGAIGLFRDELGIRLALDQTVPDWGGRMLFFRGGKMTLEVICAEEDAGKPANFWGIAYQCEDIDQTVKGLNDRGVVLSEVRDGRKPGTRVVTIKSHDLGIPTLLIQPAPRD